MADLSEDGTEQSITLEKKQMAKLLRWTIHTLEIFMWEEDYGLSPDGDVLEYADKASQEIVSYQDSLYDKPDELFFALREYFDPEPDDPDEEFE